MSLANIKAKNQGFTIVELLIVVVVIAILAAITIVSYNGITGRANKAAAQAAVATFQKKAELYSADGSTGKYPIAAGDLTADTSKSYFLQATAFSYVTDAASLTAAITASNGTSKVALRKCASGTPTSQAAITTSVTGLLVYFWDYDTGAMTASPASIGTTSGGTVACPAAA